jgi:tRNA A-37 threonylcarbamoyl transferase component Bud32
VERNLGRRYHFELSYVYIKLESKSLSEKIGRALASIHDANIIHGDLTTSNMMMRSENKSLVKFELVLSLKIR